MTEEEEEVFIYSLPKSTLSKNDLRNMLDLSSETLVMNSLASIPELINLGWNSTTSYCTWTGVTCTGLLQVQGIDISGINNNNWIDDGSGTYVYNGGGLELNINTFTDLYKCSALSTLDLSFNALVGTLPLLWAGMTELTSLNLGCNFLEGQLPIEWDGMVSLVYLKLFFNKFTGTIPDYQKLVKLQYIDLGTNAPSTLLNYGVFQYFLSTNVVASNQFRGSLPLWNNLKSLQYICFDGNAIEGALPNTWGTFSSLNQLWGQNNMISNVLPQSWGGLINLTVAHLFNNLLIGSIPASWGGMISIKYLQLGLNQLSGELPPSLSGMTSLVVLDLGNNNYNSTLPSEWSTMINLNYLGVYNCPYVYGTLPSSWKNMSAMIFLDIASNNLSGTLPEIWSSMTSINVLNLHSNHFVGTLPDSWNSMIVCTQISLTRNSLNGNLPESWSSMIALKFLDISYNNLVGTLPETWSSMKEITKLVLGQNNLLGPLPNSWGNLTAVNYLDLNQNSLTGTLPESWCNMIAMTDLYLGLNNLSGSLPNSWSSLIAITKLSFYSNNLNGALPESWNSMIALNSLILYSNNFTSTIPQSWNSMTSLSNLNLHSNNLIGTIPDSLSSLVNLKKLDLSKNSLSGVIPISLASLTQLQNLDLSYNQIYATIPSSFCGILPLISLSLQSNSFVIGDIMQLGLTSNYSTFCFPNLTSLYLSSNYISGVLDLDKLFPQTNSLSLVDLSNNSLTSIKIMKNPSRLTMLNLSSNAIDVLLTSDNFQGFTSVAVIDLTSNPFSCPFPIQFSQSNNANSLVVLKSKCVEPVSFVAELYGGIALFFTVLYMIRLILKYRFSSSDVFQSLISWNLIKIVSIAVISVIDVIWIDYNVYTTMFKVLNDIKNVNNCRVVNEANFFNIFLSPYRSGINNGNGTFWPVYPPPSWYTTFPMFLYLWGPYCNCGNNDPSLLISTFSSICNSFAGECIFNEAAMSCQENTVYNNRYDYFHTFIIISILVWVTKEFLKVFAVLYCLCRGDIPERLRYFIYSCVVTPFLLFHLKDFKNDVLDYVPTYIELLYSFFFDNILEHINQLCIYLFFFIVINQNGLSAEQLVTVPINVAMIIFKIFQIILYYINSKQKDKLHNKEDINDNGEHPESMGEISIEIGIVNALNKEIVSSEAPSSSLSEDKGTKKDSKKGPAKIFIVTEGSK